MRNRGTWTDDEEALLERLRAAGATRLEMAIALNRTLQAVKSHIARVDEAKRKHASWKRENEEKDADVVVIAPREPAPYGKTDLYNMWHTAMLRVPLNSAGDMR